MPIESDEELAIKLLEAGNILQDIQNYVGRDFSKNAKVKFPRGYLRTASDARKRLGFVKDPNLRSNIAYSMMLSDVQHWLMLRTDLSGTAKEMVIKLQLFLLGSIIESLTKDYLKGHCGKNFGKRLSYLVEKEIISEELKQEIDWVWDMRNKMHLFMLDDSEWNTNDYTVSNHNRAVRAFKLLLAQLNGNVIS